MSNVVELRSQDQRSLEASEWVARLDRGLTSAELENIRAWISSDPRNKVLLSQMAGLWDNMDGLSRLSELFPEPLPQKRPSKTRWLLAAASGFVVVMALLASVFMTMNDNNSVPGSSNKEQSIVYQTAIGGLSRFDLADGSHITLNTDSHISVEFSKHRRIIRLNRGEFHINVAHDRSRPLSVIAGDRVVEAVGTAFTIKIDDKQQIELLVTDGIVRVGIAPMLMANSDDNPAGQSLDVPETALSVSGGERFMLGQSSELLERLEPEEVEVQLSWRDGNLIFRGESLGEAVAEISRYTPVEFVFLDDSLQKVRVAGLFKTGDVTGFLSSLQANFDIAYQRIDEKTIQLSSSGGTAH